MVNSQAAALLHLCGRFTTVSVASSRKVHDLATSPRYAIFNQYLIWRFPEGRGPGREVIGSIYCPAAICTEIPSRAERNGLERNDTALNLAYAAHNTRF